MNLARNARRTHICRSLLHHLPYLHHPRPSVLLVTDRVLPRPPLVFRLPHRPFLLFLHLPSPLPVQRKQLFTHHLLVKHPQALSQSLLWIHPVHLTNSDALTRRAESPALSISLFIAILGVWPPEPTPFVSLPSIRMLYTFSTIPTVRITPTKEISPQFLSTADAHIPPGLRSDSPYFSSLIPASHHPPFARSFVLSGVPSERSRAHTYGLEIGPRFQRRPYLSFRHFYSPLFSSILKRRVGPVQ